MYCPHCGKETNEGQVFCHSCGAKIAQDSAAGTIRSRTPWEDREQRGALAGLVATLKESLFSPHEFFRKMSVKGGFSDPLVYAMITGMVGLMVFYIWQILFKETFQGYMPADIGEDGLSLFHGMGLAFAAVVLPFFIIIGLFLWSGVLHGILLMVKGAKNGFEATFRAVSYSYGANIFLIIPFCGGLIAAVWNIVLVIIGLKEAHGTSGGKASFAVFFPLILCCVGAVLFMILIFGTIAASFGTMPHKPWKM